MGDAFKGKEGLNMNIQWIKKGLAGTALALVLGFGSTTILSTTAQAQDRWHDRDDHRSERDREWARRQQAEREREWAYRQSQRNRYVYVTPRVVPRVYNGGGYYGGGYNGGGYYGGGGYEEQRGFSDGLNRGQEDARDRRSFNPNNSSHYRSGNAAYRDGFRRGYAEGYRQYGGYGRRW
jgi:hypothetical protein